MSEDEFWYTTPRYLQARIKAKRRDDQEGWVQARQIAYWSILPHLGKKRLKPQDLAKFDWEKAYGLQNPYETQQELSDTLNSFQHRAMAHVLAIEAGTAQEAGKSSLDAMKQNF